MGQEHPDVLRPLLRITRHTRERQIALAAAAPTAAWHDVLDLQRHAARIAVRAAPAPLLQHILLDLKAGQRALLIHDPRDVRVLHGLRVEPHQLQRERRDRTEPPQPLDPGQHVLHPAAQRRRQPAVFPAPVVVARLPVAGVPLPAAAAHRSPLAQPLDNRLALMGQFCGPHHLATRLFHQRQSRRATSRIDLQPQRFSCCLFHGSPQDERKGVALEDGSLACFEQQPRSSRVHWSKRAQRLVHRQTRVTCLVLPFVVCPARGLRLRG